MKKRILFLTVFIFALTFLLCSCKGDKAVTELEITSGLKTHYELGEQPDFSQVKAKLTFNDATTATVSADDLIFGKLDTSIPGEKTLEITYEGYFGITIYVPISVAINGESENILSIINVSLPDSLINFSKSKETLVDKNCDYIVGDDNEFYFTLSVMTMSQEQGPHIVTSYTSESSVYLHGSDEPLTNEELEKYVIINEEKNAFDFTEDAVGKKFTIATRPKNILPGQESRFTKSFDFLVVDGYNIYKAYELNYLTNASDGYDFSEEYSYEKRSQTEIVDAFLYSEKMTQRPENIASLVIHNDLVITTNDLPREYFVNKNRNGEFYNNLSIFNYSHNDDRNSFAIYGNCFTVDAHQLPCVKKEGTGPFDGMSSSTALFSFSNEVSDKDLNFDHTVYTTLLHNLVLIGSNPKSDTESNSDKSMRGLIALNTEAQTVNIDNSVVKYFYISIVAQDDYQTLNITDSIFNCSWQNHIYLGCDNAIQDADDEPLPRNLYPRLTVNVTNTSITESGGPAFIIQQYYPSDNCNKYSGALVNISEDSVVESYVSGNEAWFQAMKLGFVFDLLRGLDDSLRPYDSTVITEKFVESNGTSKRLQLMNIIAVNLIVPDMENGMQGIMADLMGKADVDGKIIIGSETVLDMDDYGNSKFGNTTVSNLKDAGQPQVISKTDGSVGHIINNKLIEDSGSIAAESDEDYLSVFYYSLGIVFANYHPTNQY